MTPAQLKALFWPQQEAILANLLAQELQGGSPDLVQAVQHQVMAGGKRIRALLPLLVGETIGQIISKLPNQKLAQESASLQTSTVEIKNAALYLGLSAELLHSATLCHDDIMDEDRMRRNAPTVWVKHGIPQAINAGDLLFYLGEKIIHRSPLPAESKLLALECLADCMCAVVHGQALEIELKRNQTLPSLQTYTEVVAGKTGGLFALSLLFGGIAAQLPFSQIQFLRELGMKLGEHFQIRDDILDLLGDKGRNLQASDLWESKPSWIIAQANSRLPEAERVELARLLYIPRIEKTEADIQTLLALLESSGAMQAARMYQQNTDAAALLPLHLQSWKPLFSTLIELLQSPVGSPQSSLQSPVTQSSL